MNWYYVCSYYLSAKLSTDIWILMSVVTKPICSCHDENLISHVHLNSYVTNNKFPKNNINILLRIKFFQQYPITSMRNWVCPHKSYCRAGCFGYSFSQQIGRDYHLKMEWECLLQCQDRNETRDETTVGSQSDVSTTSVPSFLPSKKLTHMWSFGLSDLTRNKSS